MPSGKNLEVPAFGSLPIRDGNPTVCAMKLGRVFALALAIGAVAPVQAAPLGEGAYRSGDYLRAVKRIGPAAERGDARAQAYLGFMYQYGRGVPQNYGLAIYWYRRAAEQGNAVGQHLLGLMYDKGMGVATDHVAAHIWLNIAASRSKGAEHEDNVRLRDAVASKMSLGQLSDAQYLARVWAPKPER
jgi:TPR repeat protein